jgi:hypothetical protein
MQISMSVIFSAFISMSVAEGSGDLSVSGTTTTDALTVSGLDCTANTNGGALTADSSGVVSCSDDDGGGNTLDAAYDQGGAGAGRTITADSGAVIIEGTGGLLLDSNNLDQMPGDPIQTGFLEIWASPNSVYVSGRYAYVVDHGTNDLKVIDVSDPSTPSLAGSLDIGEHPNSVYVSGRYAYVVDSESDDLKVIDVSNPNAPMKVGSLTIGTYPNSVYVSGRYAYVVGVESDDLRVIDVSDPSMPSEVGSWDIGVSARSVYVSGRYAYVVNSVSNDLKVIDVSDPGMPIQVGFLVIGTYPLSVYVSGRYAYVVDSGSDDLKVIDVSDPTAPIQVGYIGIGIGGVPISVYVSGRYAYVVDSGSDDLKVIDVSDPTAPSQVGRLIIGSNPKSVYVSGRYAYVVDWGSNDLKVIDISGAEVTSLIAHSLEAGNLQVRNDMIVQGQLQVSGGLNVGVGGIFSDGNVGISGTIAIANDIVPTASPANLVQLYAEDVGANSELKVRDEADNITTLSPHNFSLLGKPSEPMAWSFYSENDHGKINVDMLRTIRLVEEMSGEKLVHTESIGSLGLEATGKAEAVFPELVGTDSRGYKFVHYQKLVAPLIEAVKEIKGEHALLRADHEAIDRRLAVLEKRLR